MTAIRLYLDEDRNSEVLIRDLRIFAVDVVNSAEAGMNGKSDEEQMEFAIDAGRVLFTANVRDFRMIHTDLIARGRHHPGIVVVRQRDFEPWQQARRLLRLFHERPAETMVDSLDWLSRWQEWRTG